MRPRCGREAGNEAICTYRERMRVTRAVPWTGVGDEAALRKGGDDEVMSQQGQCGGGRALGATMGRWRWRDREDEREGRDCLALGAVHADGTARRPVLPVWRRCFQTKAAGGPFGHFRGTGITRQGQTPSRQPPGRQGRRATPGRSCREWVVVRRRPNMAVGADIITVVGT